ncbi:MAG: hypothetical protein K2N68_03465, partial [Clostridia bacterium]|nr:hypothetical protein [Clostridia bacterium]
MAETIKYKQPTSEIIRGVVLSLVKLFFLLCAALCVRNYAFYALVLVACAYVVYGIVCYFIIRACEGIDRTIAKKRAIKIFCGLIAPGVITVIVFAIAGFSQGEPDINKAVGDAAAIAVIILTLLLIIPVKKIVPPGKIKVVLAHYVWYDNIDSRTQAPQKQKILLKILHVAYCLLVLAGIFIATAATEGTDNLLIIAIIIISFVVWGCYIA